MRGNKLGWSSHTHSAVSHSIDKWCVTDPRSFFVTRHVRVRFPSRQHARCSSDDIHQRRGLKLDAEKNFKYDDTSLTERRDSTHSRVFPSHKNLVPSSRMYATCRKSATHPRQEVFINLSRENHRFLQAHRTTKTLSATRACCKPWVDFKTTQKHGDECIMTSRKYIRIPVQALSRGTKKCSGCNRYMTLYSVAHILHLTLRGARGASSRILPA